MSRTTVNKVTVWGTSFAKTGDEAQLAAVLSVLDHVAPGADVAVLDRPREQTDRFYPAVRTIRLADLWRSLSRVASSDLFVVVGAPFFETRKQVSACLALFVLCHVCRVPMVAYSITAFDLKTWWGRLLLRPLLRSMRGIGVREPIGVEVLHRLGVKANVRLVEDSRAVVDPSPAERVAALLRTAGIEDNEPVIGVTTRYMHDRVPEWVLRDHGVSADQIAGANDAVGRIIGELSGLARVLVIPMNPRLAEDEAMVEIMRRHAKDGERIALLQPPFSAADCIGLLGRCRLVVSARLASTLFALNAGTPTVAIAYDGRVEDMMKDVAEPHAMFAYRDLDADAVIAHCRRVFAEHEATSAERGREAAERKERAMREAALLLGSHPPPGISANTATVPGRG